jgi:hypothetical protein
MIKPVSELFKDQMWRKLEAQHKASVERSKINPATISQDAAIIRWSSEALTQERLNKETKK